MKKAIFILSFFLSSFSTLVNAQVDFGSYYNYSATLTNLTPGGIVLGSPIPLVASSGVTNITISEGATVAIEGVKYLDVFITITADDELLLNGNPGCIGDPSCSIDFTLEAAYANLGADNIGQATIISAGGNMKAARFPILKRTSGPAGPPPTPVYEGFDPSVFNETAYLYIYGSVNIGAVNAGDYNSNITISVSYE